MYRWLRNVSTLPLLASPQFSLFFSKIVAKAWTLLRMAFLPIAFALEPDTSNGNSSLYCLAFISVILCYARRSSIHTNTYLPKYRKGAGGGVCLLSMRNARIGKTKSVNHIVFAFDVKTHINTLCSKHVREQRRIIIMHEPMNILPDDEIEEHPKKAPHSPIITIIKIITVIIFRWRIQTHSNISVWTHLSCWPAWNQFNGRICVNDLFFIYYNIRSLSHSQFSFSIFFSAQFFVGWCRWKDYIFYWNEQRRKMV